MTSPKCGKCPKLRKLHSSPDIRGKPPAHGLSAPRACGVGRRVPGGGVGSKLCSPRVRGWSVRRGRGGTGDPLLPARAGLVVKSADAPVHEVSAPRACGVGRHHQREALQEDLCSPRVRGWSTRRTERMNSTTLLPARAGLVLLAHVVGAGKTSAPRACGVGPAQAEPRAGRGLCSPRVRGWSRERPPAGPDRPLLPARAGLVWSATEGQCTVTSAPRACGVGPRAGLSWAERTKLLPARAGLVPISTLIAALQEAAPRACGVGPDRSHRHLKADRLLPARAGLVPACLAVLHRRKSAPRACGVGPRAMPATRRTGVLLPARAGLVPRTQSGPPPGSAAPRACGVGPQSPAARPHGPACSPRVRGWSQPRAEPHVPAALLPARAGLVPPRG